MKRVSILALLLLAALATGCEEKAQVNVYDKSVLSQPPQCMRLSIFPADAKLRKELERLYPFRNDCPYTLQVDTKSQIHCNSNANAPRKTLSQFPSAYLRLELRKGMHLLYSYYRDLTHPADTEDLDEAFGRLRDDLGLGRK